MNKTTMMLSIDSEVKELIMLRYRGGVSSMVEDYFKSLLEIDDAATDEIKDKYEKKIREKYQEAEALKKEMEEERRKVEAQRIEELHSYGRELTEEEKEEMKRREEEQEQFKERIRKKKAAIYKEKGWS